MSRSSPWTALVLLLAWGVEGCDACSDEKPKRKSRRIEPSPTVVDECSAAEDCGNGDPCTDARCVGGRCEVVFVARGTSCDDDTICNGVAECDGRGQCVAGPPPEVDDHDACTLDSCDPVRGVVHEPIPVDDGDECTIDECDPRTGIIGHTSVDVDDGDDCTFDRCDPQTGVEHERLQPLYTCDATCGDGFHVASRRPNPKCGSNEALQTFCMPDCGESFYACDQKCPERYEKRTATPSSQCQPHGVSLFCMRK